MNYSKIILSLIFVSLNSFAMDTDKTLSLVDEINGSNSVELSPTSVAEINKEFLKLPKCLQARQLGDEIVSTPAVVKFQRDGVVQDNNYIPIAQPIHECHARYYPRQRNVTERISQNPIAIVIHQPVVIARPVREQRDSVDTFCALVSQCLGIN